jgi:hypothetical protein
MEFTLKGGRPNAILKLLTASINSPGEGCVCWARKENDCASLAASDVMNTMPVNISMDEKHQTRKLFISRPDGEKAIEKNEFYDRYT